MKKSGVKYPPDNAIEALARCLYPAIVAFFESDAGKREFAEWQSKRGIGVAEAQPKNLTENRKCATMVGSEAKAGEIPPFVVLGFRFLAGKFVVVLL